MKILFLSFTCEDVGVTMVTNMISQLQESFPLRRAAGSFEISFTNWLQGAKMVQLQLFLLYNFISEFHNIFVTGILRLVTTLIPLFCCFENE